MVNYVSTDKLRTGDLIRHHGMLIRLGERNTYIGDTGRTVYWFDGAVENMEEVSQPDRVTAGLVKPDGRWTVQGNELATWDRVLAIKYEMTVGTDTRSVMISPTVNAHLWYMSEDARLNNVRSQFLASFLADGAQPTTNDLACIVRREVVE